MSNQEDRCNGKKVLITGGLGLIGSTIAHKLVNNGAKVTIVDAELPRYGANHFNIADIRKKISYVQGDIRNASAMNFLVKDKDIIFNLAGQVDYNYSQQNPILDNDINCRGHLVVLEACKKNNPSTIILHAGSRMQYGKTQYNPVDEKHPTEPLSAYGVNKLATEKQYLAYNKHYGLKTICTRITNPYGPRSQMKHSKYSIVNWFLRQAMQDQEIKIFGEGNQKRDYIYVEDIAEAMIKLSLNKLAIGNVFNIGSGNPLKFKEMVQTIIDIVGKGTTKMEKWPKEWENVETGDFFANINKLEKTLKWRPSIPFREGIKRTHEFYKKHLKHYL